MNERSIFIEALERDDPAERVAFLDGACGGDTDLRARLEKLFSSYQDAQSFLEAPPNALIATISVGDLDPSDEISLDLLTPSEKPNCLGTLGQYEVVDVVGQGGMGIVLRAYDKKLNRVVAIKAVAPQYATNAIAVKRFLREARAAAAVNHDHVVTIYAIHDSQQPPFLVMEFIEGESLQDKLQRTGGFDVQEILRIGMQAASGLAAAHEQGIVHRDIKPANILLENGVERVKITDFGLARAIDDVSVTQPGLIAGTPEYMSPEQARGGPIDHRSDLFSLGGVLYAMCTGRPPFRAENSVAMLRSVLEDAPRSIREINPDVPAWLEELIASLLAKEPDDRLQSAREVANFCRHRLANSEAATPQVAESGVRRFTVFQTGKKPGQELRGIHLVFSLACITQVLGIAGTVTCMAEELEAAFPMLPLLGLIGLVVAVDGWRIARSWNSVAFGTSTAFLAVYLTLVANGLQLHPSGGDELVFYVTTLAYALVSVPWGLIVLVSVLLKPADRWPTRFQFNLRNALVVTAIIGFAFVAARLGTAMRNNVFLAVTSGLFVVTVCAAGAVGIRIVRKLAQRGHLADAKPWQRRVLIGTLIVLLACFGLARLFYHLTNEGVVVIKSPVEITVERIGDGRVERAYQIQRGGGTRWHVPSGRWEFRIQGRRSDYQISKSVIQLGRGDFVTLRIAPTTVASPPATTDTWDRLVRLAEQQLDHARVQFKAGLCPMSDLHSAEAGLIAAKLQRERSRKNQKEVMTLLEQLVQVRNKELEAVQAGYRVGEFSESDVQATMRSLIEAQAELEEASAGQ
ncbi:MAG: protein kinase [Pirellulaceae bacterium]|jgi:tRNA A-37 threonylcarbamoyl transferase component Bud32|nr:protein kinase [Pirellulaceae bacterium]MDP6721174.1 protein kinase [Pirellulaceae bacterium]